MQKKEEPVLKHYPRICVEGLRKYTKTSGFRAEIIKLATSGIRSRGANRLSAALRGYVYLQSYLFNVKDYTLEVESFGVSGSAHTVCCICNCTQDSRTPVTLISNSPRAEVTYFVERCIKGLRCFNHVCFKQTVQLRTLHQTHSRICSQSFEYRDQASFMVRFRAVFALLIYININFSSLSSYIFTFNIKNNISSVQYCL